MPTFITDVQNSQIILISAISIPGQAGPPQNRYGSLLDTGAQATLISEKVVNDIGCAAIGEGKIMAVNGEEFQTKKYRVRIDIPVAGQTVLPRGKLRAETDFRGKDMSVSLLPYQPKNYDVLLGMDFLDGFHMTLVADKLIMSS